MDEESEFYCSFDTTVGEILPFVGMLAEALKSYGEHAWAEVHFLPDGIRLECVDSHLPFMKLVIPRACIGIERLVNYLYDSDNRYMVFDYRKFTYMELIQLRDWLLTGHLQQLVTISMEADEQDVHVTLHSWQRYFGLSDCSRPSDVELR